MLFMANEEPTPDEMSSILLMMLSNLMRHMNWTGGAGIGSIEAGFDASKVAERFERIGHQTGCVLVLRNESKGVTAELPATIQSCGFQILGNSAYQIRIAVTCQTIVTPTMPTGGQYPVEAFYANASKYINDMW